MRQFRKKFAQPRVVSYTYDQFSLPKPSTQNSDLCMPRYLWRDIPIAMPSVSILHFQWLSKVSNIFPACPIAMPKSIIKLFEWPSKPSKTFPAFPSRCPDQSSARAQRNHQTLFATQTHTLYHIQTPRTLPQPSFIVHRTSCHVIIIQFGVPMASRNDNVILISELCELEIDLTKNSGDFKK